MSARLEGQVAIVTGASRGAGRAIAAALGEARATVYITGRSVRGADGTESLPGTIDETADEIARLGGTGIAVRCDHTRDAEVTRVFQRIRREHGRLDLLVNNVWGGYEEYDEAAFTRPFWEQRVARRYDRMFNAGVRAHLIASALAVPLMLPNKHGLVVSTLAWDRGLYLGNLVYDAAKAAIGRMVFGMAHELRDHGITVLGLAPGFMRTERVMAVHAKRSLDLSRTESPAYVARAVVALATAADVARWGGQIVAVGDLAPVYGFTDEDGRQPPPFRIDA
jgi:NAD(P)-dependent dehydrogenase (short-subunit alcohol dehydrogenase family)